MAVTTTKGRSMQIRVGVVMTLAIAALTLASPARAQSPVTYTLKVYNQGATTPLQSTTAPASAATCNAAPSPTTPSPAAPALNPIGVEWDDPANGGKACRLDLTAFFGGLPVNVTMIATLSYIDDRGLTNAESAVSNPFVRALPSGPLLHVRVVGGK